MPHPKLGYFLKDGTQVPGTTTVIGRFKDSGALLHWAFAQGKAAQRGEIKSLYDKRDEAAEAGTLAHAMVETHIINNMTGIGEPPDGVLDGVDEKIAIQARAAFKAYLSWESMTKLVIVEQEMQLISEQYRFGGTPDAIGQINGELCLVDWKTSNGVYCHVPGTRVLTHDWRWVPVESLRPGDALRAFTEHRVPGGHGGRHWQDAVVIGNGISRSPEGLRVILESGRQLVSTPDHPYLARRSAGGRAMTEGGTIWLTASELRVGNYLPRYFEPWALDESYEAGWFAGLLDGEGCLSHGVRRHYSSRLSFSQKPGLVLDRALAFLASKNIAYAVKMGPTGVTQITINGGISTIASVLGSTRPCRLLPKLNPKGSMMTPAGCRDRIIAIEPTGPIDVVNLTTSSGTYFADGYGSHNTDYLIQLAAYKYLWEEKYPDRPLTGGYHLCRFAKEHGDFAHHFYPNLDEAWEAFVLMRRLYDLDKQLKKRA